jgi:hypothetical protein
MLNEVRIAQSVNELSVAFTVRGRNSFCTTTFGLNVGHLPACYPMSTEVLPREQSSRNVKLTTHLNLMPRSRMPGALYRRPLLCV